MGPPLGALRVFVQHGTGLPPADLNGLADPYVKLTIRHMTRETRVVHECLNPTWDELVQFIGVQPNPVPRWPCAKPLFSTRGNDAPNACSAGPIEDFRGSELVLRVCGCWAETSTPPHVPFTHAASAREARHPALAGSRSERAGQGCG